MYIYTRIYTYLYIYIHMYIHINIYIYNYSYAHMFLYTCIIYGGEGEERDGNIYRGREGEKERDKQRNS